jgi:hypothetical protein
MWKVAVPECYRTVSWRTAAYVASIFSYPWKAHGGLVGAALIASILLPCNLRSS